VGPYLCLDLKPGSRSCIRRRWLQLSSVTHSTNFEVWLFDCRAASSQQHVERCNLRCAAHAPCADSVCHVTGCVTTEWHQSACAAAPAPQLCALNYHDVITRFVRTRSIDILSTCFPQRVQVKRRQLYFHEFDPVERGRAPSVATLCLHAPKV